MVNIYIFLDTVKNKSRMFIRVSAICTNPCLMFIILFSETDQGVALLKYAIQGNEYTLRKRSIQIIDIQKITLFSMNGIYTLFKDRKQELMTSQRNIYRETGTVSREVEQNHSHER